MIRVNLLDPAGAEAGRQGAASFDGLRILAAPGTKLALVAVLLALGNGFSWLHFQRQQQALAEALQSAQVGNRQLAAVKANYIERQREAEELRQRVQVIEQLRAQQSGPLDLLKAMGETGNRTEAVWLSSMKDQGASVDLEGMALSADAVANLMMNLKKSGFFSNIEIKETFQDEGYKEAQAFQFVLTCEKAKS